MSCKIHELIKNSLPPFEHIVGVNDLGSYEEFYLRLDDKKFDKEYLDIGIQKRKVQIYHCPECSVFLTSKEQRW